MTSPVPGPEPSGNEPSFDPRWIMIMGSVLVSVFGGLALWGLLGEQAADVKTSTPVAARVALREEAPDEFVTKIAEDIPREIIEDDSPPPSSLSMRPQSISTLLAQQFQRQSADGPPTFTSLRSILGASRGVTVLNVWATYCEPCKREFPGFRKLQGGWENDVRFVPVQLGEGTAGVLREVMPEAPDQLVDYMPGGAVQTALFELDLLPKDAKIPVTVVLDCRQNLRWLHEGEVKDMAAFDEVVQELRQELRSSYCALRTSSRPNPETKSIFEPSKEVVRPASPCSPPCPTGQECRMQKLTGRYICAPGV